MGGVLEMIRLVKFSETSVRIAEDKGTRVILNVQSPKYKGS